MLASTARPSAPAIMNEVLTMPEASPDSVGATSLMAASSTGLRATPLPTPSSTIPGSTCTRKLPSDGESANSPSPAACSARPQASGARMP